MDACSKTVVACAGMAELPGLPRLLHGCAEALRGSGAHEWGGGHGSVPLRFGCSRTPTRPAIGALLQHGWPGQSDQATQWADPTIPK